MAVRSLPRWLVSWLDRWLPRRKGSRRGYRAPVRQVYPTLTQLEERFSASALGIATQAARLSQAPVGRSDAIVRTASADSFVSEDWPGVTATEDIRLVSSPAEEALTNRPSSELAPAEEQPTPKENLSPLDHPFNQLSNQPPLPRTSPTKLGDNMANRQALAGAGRGPGGISTPNLGGGGGGGGGGAANITNANQFMSANLGAAGTVSTAGTPQATALPAGPAPVAATSALATPAVQPANSNAPTAAATQASSAASAPAHSSAAPPAPRSVTPGLASGDPLYVLDMNESLTLPNNATINTFSTWSENLLAQVSGATVSSYSWNVSGAPDLTSVSGTTTANLQGTWATFSTGGPRSDTIKVTETPTSGSPLTVTLNFVVTGTNSPAYASSRPTTSSTWQNVLTPDLVQAGQGQTSDGLYSSLGLTDGSAHTSFSMPSYNPHVDPLQLDYSSTAADSKPIFLAHYQLSSPLPGLVTAQLTLNSTLVTTTTYNTTGLNPSDWIQIALQVNASGLSSGRYPWQISIYNGTATTSYSGNVDLINQNNSPFGAGWSLDNVEQLLSVTGGLILEEPGGSSLWFANGTGGGYVTPAGDFSSLVKNGDSSYTRTMPDGTKINFNPSGLQTSIVDRDGNTTSFTYNTSNLLTSITDFNGQTTTLSYSSGLLTSIEDPALRTATLTYSGAQLTSISDPASEVWKYAYNSSNDLTMLTDPRSNAATFSFNSNERVTSVTQPDGSTTSLAFEQLGGLKASSFNQLGINSIPAVLLAVGDQATYKDPRGNVWTTELDWLGFGLNTEDIDPLGDAALTYRDTNGLPWMSSDPLGRRTARVLRH